MRLLTMSTALLALAAGAAFAESTSVVRMGTEGAYPPYNFINDKGEVDGFERELGDELCRRAGLTCEWVTTDWDSIIPNLVSGNYDTIIAGMSITEERDQVIDFTQDYYPPTASAYVATSAEADITGVVAAQVSTIQAAYVAESGATLLEFATPEETIAAVRNGEADAVFADYDYLLPIVEASGGELMFVGDRVPLGGGVGMGLRESDTELRDKFDAAITSMKADGTLNALLVKWFGEGVQTYPTEGGDSGQ
jgi:polar amino acid transport system substrate-binding protein